MTDVIAQADLGDQEVKSDFVLLYNNVSSTNKKWFLLQSLTIVQSFERFICANPKIKIIDPFDNLRQLLDRYQTYSKINNSDLHKAGMFPKVTQSKNFLQMFIILQVKCLSHRLLI